MTADLGVAGLSAAKMFRVEAAERRSRRIGLDFMRGIKAWWCVKRNLKLLAEVFDQFFFRCLREVCTDVFPDFGESAAVQFIQHCLVDFGGGCEVPFFSLSSQLFDPIGDLFCGAPPSLEIDVVLLAVRKVARTSRDASFPVPACLIAHLLAEMFRDVRFRLRHRGSISVAWRSGPPPFRRL